MRGNNPGKPDAPRHGYGCCMDHDQSWFVSGFGCGENGATDGNGASLRLGEKWRKR